MYKIMTVLKHTKTRSLVKFMQRFLKLMTTISRELPIPRHNQRELVPCGVLVTQLWEQLVSTSFTLEIEPSVRLVILQVIDMEEVSWFELVINKLAQQNKQADHSV